MLYLLEATYTDKESQALYDNFADETALLGAFETKLGQAMKSESIKAEMLIAFASDGKILANEYHSKDNEIELSPRLVWITTDSEGENANMQKYSTLLEAEANFHLKRGTALGNADVKSILTMTTNSMNVNHKEFWARPIEPVEPEEPQE